MNAAIIAAYGILYAAIHSWLASQRMKDWARRTMGSGADRWYRLAYNALATVMLLPFLAMLVWLPDQSLYVIPPPWVWLTLLVQAVAAAGVVYGVWITDGWHFLGLRQLFQTDEHRSYSPPLAVYGLYRWVRHPLYFLGLVFMWLSPRMTVNTLALYAVFSVYLYVGTFFEERRLIAEFGDAYREYQRQVPRLLPWRGPVRVALSAPIHQKATH
jgi:protein-S-isoprenylcysteine O-methyltransferase Ste14